MVIAAREGRPGDAYISMKSHGAVNTSDPDYDTPQLKDLQLVFIAFDILYVDDQVGI